MRRFVFSLILLIAGVSLWAQEPASAKYAPAPSDKALLWKVTGKGMKKTPSYVYGTIHMIGRSDYFLTKAAKSAFESVKHVAFEIDMEDMTDMSKMMPLMMKAFMVGDTTLKDLLTEEEYAQVSTHFQEVGLPMMFVDRIKPMFLSVLGSGEDMMGMSPGGESSMVSYEMEFMKMAQEREMDIDGLETAEFQMSMFDSIPYKVQAQMLMDAINSEDGGSTDQFDEMVKMYKDQDIYAMQQIMDDEGGIAGYEDLLLVRRNRNWIPVMEEAMKERPTFFAVGAGHLGGDEGVIALLREAGYKVEPVN
ncbi:MAG: TraB/GumN family protein [Mameliella sp.]|nr:TraB/GumN family protein [Phaeodactylibacter sp.]NRA51436.1 TraB/GumN family protein [Phaeodactylibacter sp.]